MTRTHCCIVALLAGCLALANRPAYCRQVPDWEFDVLIERSDVVVIATPIAREQVKVDVTTLEPWASELKDGPPGQSELLRQIFNFNVDLVAEVSTFKVSASLKGDFKEQEIKVVHFTWKATPQDVEGRPYFFTEGLTAENAKTENLPPEFPREHCYMLFLDRREDGLFGPATGQNDSMYSIKHIEQLRESPPEPRAKKESP